MLVDRKRTDVALRSGSKLWMYNENSQFAAGSHQTLALKVVAANLLNHLCEMCKIQIH